MLQEHEAGNTHTHKNLAPRFKTLYLYICSQKSHWLRTACKDFTCCQSHTKHHFQIAQLVLIVEDLLLAFAQCQMPNAKTQKKDQTSMKNCKKWDSLNTPQFWSRRFFNIFHLVIGAPFTCKKSQEGSEHFFCLLKSQNSWVSAESNMLQHFTPYAEAVHTFFTKIQQWHQNQICRNMKFVSRHNLSGGLHSSKIQKNKRDTRP